MARASKRAADEAKGKSPATAPAVAPAPAPAVPQTAPAPFQQVSMQMGIPQGTLGLHPTPTRHIDPEGFIRVRDSVSQLLHFKSSAPKARKQKQNKAKEIALYVVAKHPFPSRTPLLLLLWSLAPRSTRYDSVLFLFIHLCIYLYTSHVVLQCLPLAGRHLSRPVNHVTHMEVPCSLWRVLFWRIS